MVLGLDFRKIVDEVHPSLHEAGLERYTYVSDSILDGLTQVVLKLKKEKEVRLRKVNNSLLLLYTDPNLVLKSLSYFINPCLVYSCEKPWNHC